MIPISFVVGIAEIGIGSAGVEDQREVDHLAGIASIERPGENRFVGGEGCGVDPDAERQGKHRDGREPGIAAQCAGSVAQVLDQFGDNPHVPTVPALFFHLVKAA